MARFLAVDWDHSEVRFLYGISTGSQILIQKAGAESIENSVSAPAEDVPSTQESDSDGGEDPSPEPAGVSTEESENSEPAAEPAEPDSDDDGEPVSEETKPKKGKQVSAKDREYIARGQALKRLLRKNGVPGSPMILCLPRDRAELLNLNLPRLSESELPDIVKNQVLRDSTVYLEGHPLDFIPLGGEPKSPTQKLLSASITRIELKHLRTFSSAAGRKAARIELRLTALAEFFRAGKIETQEPVLLFQEGDDEISFALFEQGIPIYFRAIQNVPSLSETERRNRFKTEILRTLQVGSGKSPVSSVILLGVDGEYDELTAELEEGGVTAETLNPFLFSGISAKAEIPPARVSRFAPLLGALLAERGKKERPILDFLHPRQKPKPPNFTLYFLMALVLIAAVLAGLWRWNVKDLARKTDEVARLGQELNKIQGEYNQLQPQFTILSSTQRWTQYGVTVLDELRDIFLRLPPVPDMLVSRMAFNGFDPQYGGPVFIISAKINQPGVYMQFYQKMTADGAFAVKSNGVVQTPSVSDDKSKKPTAEYGFTAVILCRRRNPDAYIRNLPKELRDISEDKPEFYDQQRGAGQPQNQPNPDTPNPPKNQPNTNAPDQFRGQPNPSAPDQPQNQPNADQTPQGGEE